jgi:hypothetical protein
MTYNLIQFFSSQNDLYFGMNGVILNMQVLISNKMKDYRTKTKNIIFATKVLLLGWVTLNRTVKWNIEII